MKKHELKKILKKHETWLKGEPVGEQANLSRLDLSGVDLHGVDLSYAYLCGTNLCGANLSGANLHGGQLYDADLSGADLSGTKLSGARLFGAQLCGTKLCGADMSEADLRKTDLSDAQLCGAVLRGANLRGAQHVPTIPMACPATGEFIGWKKCRKNYIVKLKILEDSRRSSATGRKCRCDKALVLEIQNMDGTTAPVKSISSRYDAEFVYTVGQIAKVQNFCEDRFDERAEGIHFFINRDEAVNYNL